MLRVLNFSRNAGGWGDARRAKRGSLEGEVPAWSVNPYVAIWAIESGEAPVTTWMWERTESERRVGVAPLTRRRRASGE
jgi:hypothetical protein